MKTQQPTMFESGEDLPLFSGTVQTVTIESAPTHNRPAEQTSFAQCPLCLDTGKVGDQCCWCDAGVALKTDRKDRQ